MVTESRVRPAFSLIELLTVIAIIATLSALLVASAGALSSGSKKSRTDSILGAVRNAVELTLAEQGMAASAAEHPLAGSREPRTTFVRANGGAVAATGVALVLSGRTTIADVQSGKQSRVLLPEDRFADPAVPQLYGTPRHRLGILGVPQAGVTKYRKLPTNLDASVDPDSLPDGDYLIAPKGTPQDHQAHLERLLGAAAGSELASLGALRTPPADYTVAIAYGRVLTSGNGVERWKPDHIRDGTLSSGPGAGQPAWKPYRLPGVAIYDGWGTEVLYAVKPSGFAVISAGADRVFRFDPGKDHTVATAADANDPAGDDRDGSLDNRVQAVGD